MDKDSFGEILNGTHVDSRSAELKGVFSGIGGSPNAAFNPVVVENATFWKNGIEVKIADLGAEPSELKRLMQNINGRELDVSQKQNSRLEERGEFSDQPQPENALDRAVAAGQIPPPIKSHENPVFREFLDAVKELYDTFSISTMAIHPKIQEMIMDADIYRADT